MPFPSLVPGSFHLPSQKAPFYLFPISPSKSDALGLERLCWW